MNRLQNTQSIISGLEEIMRYDQTLLPLQRDVLEQFKSKHEQHQTGIFDLATGFGKTCIMSALMTAYLQKNPTGKVVVVVPTKTLIENEADSGHIERLKDFFKSFNQKFSSDILDVGAFFSDKKEPQKQVVITTYNSLNNLRNQIDPKEVGLLLLDEAHHTITDKRIAAVKSFENASQYGMTATPFYSPEKSLSMVLGKTIAQVDIKQAIQQGLLSNVKNILMVSDISVDLATELGNKQDYSEEEYKKAIENALKSSANTNPGNSGNPMNWEEFRKEMADNVAKLYRDYVDENLGAVNGQQCMINCRTQEEARIQAKAINTLFGKEVAGWWTTDSEDKTVLDKFGKKELNVICQVGKLTEGFDDPEIAVCINYPTASQVLEEQRSGRPLHKVQNTKKEALVIDLCFRHPDYDNEVDAIRQNNQKLFMDILGAPVIRCEEIATEKQPDKKDNPISHKHTATLPKLHGFHIISNTQELVRLTQEADKLKDERYIPPKREGMWSSVDLNKKYGKGNTIFAGWLEDAFNDKEVFYLSSDKKHEHSLHLVEYVNANGMSCYCLHKAPEALKRFIELHPELLESLKNKKLPPKRDGMLSSTDIKLKYHIRDERANKLLKNAFNDKEVFYLEVDKKHEHPLFLVEYVKSQGFPCHCLHEAPEALKRFEELHPELLESLKNKKLPPKRDGMLSSKDIHMRYSVHSQFAGQQLKNSFNNNEVFYLESDKKHEYPIPLVEYVNSNGMSCYCLHEAPEALKRFEELHPELLESLKNKQLPLKRDGMLSSMGLYKKHGGNLSMWSDWIENAFKNKEMFYLESDKKHEHPLPLVEYVKPKSWHPSYCLHEAPEAWEALKKWLKKTYGKELKERTRTLRPTLQEASEKGKTANQPVKAPNPPQTGAKPVAKHRTKSVQNTANRSGPTI